MVKLYRPNYITFIDSNCPGSTNSSLCDSYLVFNTKCIKVVKKCNEANLPLAHQVQIFGMKFSHEIMQVIKYMCSYESLNAKIGIWSNEKWIQTHIVCSKKFRVGKCLPDQSNEGSAGFCWCRANRTTSRKSWQKLSGEQLIKVKSQDTQDTPGYSTTPILL